MARSATVEIFWKAFGALKRAERAALAERILRDQELLEDIYDHLLIEQAKRGRGKAVTLNEYLADRKRPRA